MQKQEVIFGLEGLGDVWLIEPRAGRALMWKLCQLQRSQFDLTQLYPQAQAIHHDDESEQKRMDRLIENAVTFVGDRAIVAIRGTLTKHPTMSSWFFGEGVMTYTEIADVVVALANVQYDCR